MAPTRPPRPPYLGAAYYPEAWPADEVDRDIRLMKEAGLNVARIAEFAWSRMEPEEGRYDFDWLHCVVDRLGEAKIATILGTPTATPPAWLHERYPEAIAMDAAGRRLSHGARRHACPTSPVYRDLCGRIVTRMAGEFGRDENVIGWQIDNELFPPQGGPCCCPSCAARFRAALRERFGSIGALNAAWGTDLWSQTYSSFDQVPIPDGRTWHHPSLLLAWTRFVSDAYAEFSDHQAAILHERATQPVGTDMMPTNKLSYERMHRVLDLVQHNHYHGMENLWEAAFWFDLCRPIKPAPFWNTETATCWNGGTTAKGYKEPGFCRANSWLPFALGGEANLYWLWRAHWSGQELMHGSVVSSCGRPLHVFGEVQEVTRGLAAAADFLNGTRPVRTGLALHFSSTSWWLFNDQPMVDRFIYRTRLAGDLYRPLARAQWRPDLVDPAADLAPYRLVLSPFLPILDEAGLRGRLAAWIEAGGTWVAGPLTDVRTVEGTKFTAAPYGSLEEWAGVRCLFEIPGSPRDFALRWADGVESAGSIWYDGLELAGAEALATYTEGPLAGLAAVAQRRMGKGRVVLLGTLPRAADLARLLARLAAEAGVERAAGASENLLVVPREGAAGRGLIAVEHENRPASLALARPATDLLTGERHAGSVEVPPYGVMVLQEK